MNWRSAEVTIPTRCRAHRFQNGPGASPVNAPIGHRGRLRSCDLSLRKRVLCPAELRDALCFPFLDRNAELVRVAGFDSGGLLRPRQALLQAELYPVVIGDPWENRTPATASTARRPATERKGHGAHRRSRISKHHLLKMAALPVCLCAHCHLVNPGFEPGTGFRLPIKSRVPSAARRHWSVMG